MIPGYITLGRGVTMGEEDLETPLHTQMSPMEDSRSKVGCVEGELSELTLAIRDRIVTPARALTVWREQIVLNLSQLSFPL
jgi:hypothetical protein